ncbi:hypothetical protein MVEN_01483500 [Mycena venus]|uniref:Uncharacterized protein n=1 Tax=Mycena venus TaxID=2733690 RepID=A0A8H6XSJ6_9AGAR|nr:hypothetical protein MVEN_01483500 [Mycena venus]
MAKSDDQLSGLNAKHRRVDARAHRPNPFLSAPVLAASPSSHIADPAASDEHPAPDLRLYGGLGSDSDSDPRSYGLYLILSTPSPLFAFSSDSESDSEPGPILDGNVPSDDEDEPGPASPTDSDNEDITQDPLFRSRASLFDPFQSHNETVMPMEELGQPRAFDDHPAIRHAYVRVFLDTTFKGMKHDSAASMLDGFRVVFQSASAAGVEYPGLSNFARTLSTVEKRLGVSTDTFITYFFLCNVCWKPHCPAELTELVSPECDQPNCDGKLYTLKRLSGGAEKRTPLLTLPFVPPEKAIQRMCLQPGKVAQWQEWRRPDDVVQKIEPSLLTGYEAFPDLDKPMKDISDGWGWRAVQSGLERRRNGLWEIRDVDVDEVMQRFVALPNGLIIQINIDWFQAVKNACHSTGALYATICNNPRQIRFLWEETILLMMFPGPHEPTQDQWNNVMEICVKHFQKLYAGMSFRVHGKDEKEPFHHFMCDHCDVPFYALGHPDTYDSTKLTARDPWRYLKYAFRAREASKEVAEEISRRRGVRFSVMNNLPNWLPGVSGLFDLMHCIFGALIKHIVKNVLYKTGMIDANAGRKLEEFFARLIWPPSVSRLPPSASKGAGSIKADQWRSLIAVFFVGLFTAWEVNGEIPDIDAPPSASNTKNAAAQAAQEKLVRARMLEHLRATNPNPPQEEIDRIKSIKMDRSLPRHFDTLVQFTAAVRILTSNFISPNEVKRGCAHLEGSIQEWARMHCHLVPYFHFAVHLEPQFLKHGPGPGWWTYPYERNNGLLGRFNNNGHSGGEMEGTMMRGWWKATLVQDLITRFEAIPNRGPEDEASLELLKSHLKGGTSERKGTLQNYISRVQSETNPNEIVFPRFSQSKILRQLGSGYYGLVLKYLQQHWGPEFVVIPDVSTPQEENEISFSGDVDSFSHVWVKKQRYGAGEEHRGQSAKYAYIDCRVPVHIDRIFRAHHKFDEQKKIVVPFAILRRFEPCTTITDFPWDVWATDIGVSVWKAEALGPQEVVSLDRLTGHFVLAPITVRKQDLWVTIAYDHDATEADVFEDAE